MAAADERWTFEDVDPHASGASGKISDLFRNEEVDEPGLFVIDKPSATATLMAREVIQNSWDAAQELRGNETEIAPFALDFHFRSARGDERADLVEALGLRQLARHAAVVAPSPEKRRTDLGLGADDCLLDLDRDLELSVCRIVEHGASGMYGRWYGAASRMYLAMLSSGYNQKADGSGGTFGFGKAGLIRASHPKIVIAYSCFREQEQDEGVTRRLLGVTYWGPHDRDGVAYKGFARLGRRDGAGIVPFQNDEADHVATSMGFEVRVPNVAEQLGTSFLIVDPMVDPDHLREAVERNWWPALLEGKFTVLVTTPDGTELPCRPRRNERLTSFVQAFDELTVGDPSSDRVRIKHLAPFTPAGGERYELGRLALVADPASWSFPDETGMDAGIESRSMVALSRDPRMVVEYYLPGRDISRRVPYVRGVFLASSEVNKLLGRTEPKAHNKWDTTLSDDVDPTATRVAQRILDLVKQHVRDFQNELRPPDDHTGAVRLQRLDDKLKKLRDRQGTKPRPIPPGERPFTFGLDVKRRAIGDGELTLEGRVTVGLAPDIDESELPARIRISFAIDEDGRRGDSVPLHVDLPAGFVRVAGDEPRFEGPVPIETVVFDLRSESYRADWTGQLLISGEKLDEQPTAAP